MGRLLIVEFVNDGCKASYHENHNERRGVQNDDKVFYFLIQHDQILQCKSFLFSHIILWFQSAGVAFQFINKIVDNSIYLYFKHDISHEKRMILEIRQAASVRHSFIQINQFNTLI